MLFFHAGNQSDGMRVIRQTPTFSEYNGLADLLCCHPPKNYQQVSAPPPMRFSVISITMANRRVGVETVCPECGHRFKRTYSTA
jgi:hypothetical protein